MLQPKRFTLALAFALALVAAFAFVQQSSARTVTAFGVPLSGGGTTVCLEDFFLPDDIYLEVTYSGERQGSTVILRGTAWVFGPTIVDLAYNLADDTWSHMYPDASFANLGTEKGYWDDTSETGNSVWFEIWNDNATYSGVATWVMVDCSTLPLAQASAAIGGRGSAIRATETATAAGADDSITLFGTEVTLSGGGTRICAAAPGAPVHIYMDVTYAGEREGSTVILRGTGQVIDPEPRYIQVAYNLADDTWAHGYTDVLTGGTFNGFEKGYYNEFANVGDTVRVENDGFSGLGQWEIVDCSTLP
jgi:hypothetical protein